MKPTVNYGQLRSPTDTKNIKLFFPSFGDHQPSIGKFRPISSDFEFQGRAYPSPVALGRNLVKLSQTYTVRRSTPNRRRVGEGSTLTTNNSSDPTGRSPLVSRAMNDECGRRSDQFVESLSLSLVTQAATSLTDNFLLTRAKLLGTIRSEERRVGK